MSADTGPLRPSAVERRRQRVGDAGPRRRLQEHRREALLDRLQSYILVHGFAHLTVEELARELQCSKSTLYVIASTRDLIVTAAIKQFFRQATEQVESALDSIDDPATCVSVYLDGVGRQMSRMSWRCYDDMVAFAGTREVYDLNSRAAARRVRQLVEDGVSSGAFRSSIDPRFVAEVVSLVIDGIQDGTVLQHSDLTSGMAYGELAKLVLGALGHRQH